MRDLICEKWQTNLIYKEMHLAWVGSTDENQD